VGTIVLAEYFFLLIPTIIVGMFFSDALRPLMQISMPSFKWRNRLMPAFFQLLFLMRTRTDTLLQHRSRRPAWDAMLQAMPVYCLSRFMTAIFLTDTLF
jgi:hypothetical protein